LSKNRTFIPNSGKKDESAETAATEQAQDVSAESLDAAAGAVEEIQAVFDEALSSAAAGAVEESNLPPIDEKPEAIEPTDESPAEEAPASEPEPAVEEKRSAEPEPIVAPVPDASKSTEPISDELSYLEKIRIDGTHVQKRTLAALESFVQEFPARTDIVPDKAARIQSDLLSNLLWTIERDFEEFKQGWNVALVFFAAHYGKPTPTNHSAISEYSTHRYFFAWNKSEDQLNAYRGLVTLLRTTRDRNTRRHDVKSIDLDRVAPNVLSERGLNNLKSFYNV
jgi:hypothetical protein